MSRTPAVATFDFDDAAEFDDTNDHDDLQEAGKRARRHPPARARSKRDGAAQGETDDARSRAKGRTGAKSGKRSPPMSSLSDEELLEGIREQSEPHFAALYDRYFRRIYNFVYVRIRNHAEAEEVVQETFLAVFRSFERYRGQSSLLSWIYGIAKNTTNNSIRRSKSQNERVDLADEDDLIPRPSLGAGMPDEQFDLKRFRDQLSERLDGVADWQTEIFEMRHFENLSIPEISERTTRSSDAVRSSLYRVKRIFFEAADASHSGPVHGGRR